MALNNKENRIYIAIDLKSYYASVECVERGLDPLDTNLVVADPTRTEKTICLAVSPSLKSYGVSGRARLFEVVQRVREINAARLRHAPGGIFTGKSSTDSELKTNPALELDYVVAPPRMRYYMNYSTSIYQIYLKYVSAEDIHVYSIDEVFMDVTHYLKSYGMTARQLAMTIIHDVLDSTGITSTAGIGTNLYLAKIAMDIYAKHMPADENGVRLAELDEISYRKHLWDHTPITDFWRVGRGYAKKLAGVGIYTMGDLAACSLGSPGDFHNEALLHKLFGINAELLIDHAWGVEPVTIADIRKYRPRENSLTSGQVLQCPYPWDKARLVTMEMTELLAMDMLKKGLVTDKFTLTIGYDIANLEGSDGSPAGEGNGAGRRGQGTINSGMGSRSYKGKIVTDFYGRQVPEHGHGTVTLPRKTSSARMMMQYMGQLYDRITDKNLLVRRITVVAANVISESRCSESGEFSEAGGINASAGFQSGQVSASAENQSPNAEKTAGREQPEFNPEPDICGLKIGEQMDLFTDYKAIEAENRRLDEELRKDRQIQEAMLEIKRRFGKNAVIRGMNMEEGATAIDRNNQVGGHKAE